MKKTVMEDSQQNSLIIESEGYTITIFFKRLGTPKRNRIMTINTRSRIATLTRKRSKHLLKANSSYGFNYEIMSKAKSFDIVNIIDEHESWSIPRDELLKKSRYMHFKQQGFELQKFITLFDLKPFKTEQLF